MKITFLVAGWSLSGGDRVIAIYADRLRRRGHDVLIVAPGLRKPTLREQLSSVKRGRGWISGKEPPTHLDRSVPHRRLESFRDVTDADLPDADVVIATWWETAEWVGKLSSSKGAKAFFLQGYEALPHIPKDSVDAVWQLPLHKITISKWLVDLARDRFGDNNVSLVYNSVDTQQFRAPPRGKNAVPTVGMLYYGMRWKGTDVCLDALQRLDFPTKVVSFGADVPKPGKNGYPALPRDSEFHFRPPQDRLAQIYASCDVWLCGSRGEGFHLPPLEAMACRCPVVSTAVGGPTDIVVDGVNGYVVPIEDAAGLADRLSRVLKLPDADWRKLSDSAHATATRYSWDDATVLFEQALQRAVERRARGEIG